MARWWIGGALALTYLLINRSRAEAISIIHRSTRAQDIDALTRMLITETGFNRNRNEMAQIVFVAINRATRYNISLREAVSPARRAFPAWNTAAAYRKRFQAADESPRWDAARLFVQQVLAGAYSNSGATKFVHPGGMPRPPCSGTRVAISTAEGRRCVPSWIASGRRVGGALFA